MFNLKRDLSGDEVVRRVYKSLAERLRAYSFQLPREFKLVIGNDSCDHKTRIGYMKYVSGHLITTAKRQMVVALGTAEGAYPARPYACDLMALDMNWVWRGAQGVEEFFSSTKGSEFAFDVRTGHTPFGYSPLVAMANGELRAGWLGNSLASRIEKTLADPAIKDMIFGQPGGLAPRWYASKLVPILTDMLIAAFSD